MYIEMVLQLKSEKRPVGRMQQGDLIFCGGLKLERRRIMLQSSGRLVLFSPVKKCFMEVHYQLRFFIFSELFRWLVLTNI